MRVRMPPRALALLGLLAAGAAAATGAGGCIDAFDPEVGPPLAPVCADTDSDPANTVSYSGQIVPLLLERCAGCHTPGGRAPVGIEVGGLDASTYSSLRAGGAVSAASIVVEGRPCASALVQKVKPLPPFGARMPLSGPPFLGGPEIQLLHDWVAEGAHEN